jgi:hypothetical protein
LTYNEFGDNEGMARILQLSRDERSDAITHNEEVIPWDVISESGACFPYYFSLPYFKSRLDLFKKILSPGEGGSSSVIGFEWTTLRATRTIPLTIP